MCAKLTILTKVREPVESAQPETGSLSTKDTLDHCSEWVWLVGVVC